MSATVARGTPEGRPPTGRVDMWRPRRTDGSVAAGWYVLPLRLFLGVTFLFAGLQKLANPDFFRASSPISIHAQLLGASHTSPIGGLLGHLVGSASGIGALIAVAEVAVGVGALLGLLTRVAAVGGMLVSLGLFLAISFHSRPYFTGSDIVFLFAWTPLVLAGAAGAPALDTWLAGRRDAARAAATPGEEVVPEGARAAGRWSGWSPRPAPCSSAPWPGWDGPWPRRRRRRAPRCTPAAPPRPRGPRRRLRPVPVRPRPPRRYPKGPPSAGIPGPGRGFGRLHRPVHGPPVTRDPEGGR